VNPTQRPSAQASLDDWLHYQEALHAQPIELGLERVAAVARTLGLLDAPPPTLTVGGTNGKGSASTLASLCFREAGYRTGLYTSPHLLHYRERVAVDGVPCGDEELIAAFDAIETARGATPLTYFEFGTLAALLIFARRKVDIQVLEVGLGGRLDAVNIIDADVALVTSIGLDHQDWLGPDREAIGFEKAGIYRSGRTAICAEPDPPLSLLHHASEIGASLHRYGAQFSVDPDGDGSAYVDTNHRIPLPKPGMAIPPTTLAGSIAAVVALSSRLPVDSDAIQRAVSGLFLPGRCERRGAIVLDVSHNAEAVRVLCAALRRLDDRPRWRLVLGMLADKPVEACCALLREVVGEAHFASLPGPRGLTAEALAERAASVGLHGSPHADIAQALAAAEQGRSGHASEEPGIVVCGSFLTVAAALETMA